MKSILQNRIYILLIAALVLLFGAGACSDDDTVKPTQTDNTISPTYGDVAPAQAKTLIDANSGNSSFVILDVRTPGEFAGGHIAGAVNLDYSTGTFADGVAKLDQTKTYLVYCRSGNRSASATAYMKQQGFVKIYNMTGGANEWSAAGYTLVQ